MDTGIEGGTSSFGEVVREERGMENDVRRGVMSGKRRRGRPITRCQDNVYTIKGLSINSMIYHGTPEIEANGDVLPRLSPGVGHDPTA